MERKTQLIIGLDVDKPEEALNIVAAAKSCDWFKIGSQLYLRCGPSIVEEILGMGKHVFLDLKFHDIPNTVAKASRAAVDLGVDLFTVHASGGRKMIEAARDSVEGSITRILAVTILTSLTDDMLRKELGLHETAAEAVPRYAKLAVESGAHGLVCSALEIELVREAVGPKPLIVTPGIRPVWAGKDDQARVKTPREARDAGADFIVVVRPITKHQDPEEAVRLIQEELGK